MSLSDRDGFMPPPDAPSATAPSPIRRWLLFLLTVPLYALAGGVVGWLGARHGREWIEPLLAQVPSFPFIGLLLFWLLSLWPNVVLHEAGHAVAGIARGMRPIAMGVGPLRWDKGLDGWRFRYGGWIGGISGFAALLPQGERGQSRSDQILFTLGGPVANLLTVAACLAGLPLAAGSPWLVSLLLGMGLGALMFGLVNLVPFQAQGWRSDGRVIVDLVRRRPDANLQQQMQQLLALSMSGVRPRDWPPALVAGDGGASRQPMLAMNADLLRLAWEMDRDDMTAAAETTRQLITRMPSVPAAMRPHCAVGVAGFVARALRDPAVLRAWRPLCEGGITDLSPIRAWLDAELAVLGGDRAEAVAAIVAARAALARLPDPATEALMREYLDDLDTRLPA